MSTIQIHDGGTNSKERTQTYGEVFTNRETVNMMLDLLEQENTGEDCFSPEKTFLDPACGEGQFPLEILRRKFQRCKKKSDFETAVQSVYGFDIQADNISICIENVLSLCRENFKVSKKMEQEIKRRYIQCDSLKVMPLLAEYTPRHWFTVPGPWMELVEPGGGGTDIDC